MALAVNPAMERFDRKQAMLAILRRAFLIAFGGVWLFIALIMLDAGVHNG